MATYKLLGATVLAAALLGGCAQRDQNQPTEHASSRGTLTENEEVVEEPPYEFEDIFPDGRNPLQKDWSDEIETQYSGSVHISHPEPGEDGRERDMMLHVKIRDRDDDYATRGWQEDDYLTFRVTNDFNEIRIIDTSLNLRCDERDFVKDEIDGGTFRNTSWKSRKHCNSYMEYFSDKLVDALNDGQEWSY